MAKKPTDPIAQFMQEHNTMLLQLKKLNRAVTAISSDGFSSQQFRTVRASLRFINDEVSNHNQQEERALFPILERYVDGPTRLMRSDHRQMQKQSAQLRKAVERLDQHRDSFAAMKNLSRVAGEIVQQFVNHIHKENYVLFPLIRQFLSDDVLREVAKKMV